MKIAVVILNWNGKDLLEQFLPSVVNNSGDADIYVADNASTDDSVSFVYSNYKTVNVIQNPKNYGFAEGYNKALAHLTHDLFVLLNSDVEVTPGWLDPILTAFKEDAKLVAAQPKILDFKNNDHFEYAGAAGGFIDSLGYPFCRGRIFNTIEKDKGQYDDERDIFWASGACFFIRSQVFHQLKGFDQDYFAHQEEIDLCWRIHNANYEIKYVADALVYHVGGATLKESNPKKTYLNFRNGLFLLLKNLPFSHLLVKLPVRLLLDWMAAIKFLLGGQWKHALQVLHAHASFAGAARKMAGKRSHLSALVSRRLIVVAHFLKGKKIYSKL